MQDKPAVVIAVDVGSTSARAAAFDARGVRLARVQCGFSVSKPLPDHAEHNSEEIWRAVATAIREVLAAADIRPEDVAGLAFDATCSLALFDTAGRPVTASSTGEDRWN